MPNITVDIDSLEKTVTREVVLNVVYDLIAAMGITNNAKIIFPGTKGPEDIPFSTPDVNRDNGYDPELKVIISATEEYVEEKAIPSNVSADENVPLFRDPVLDIVVAPIYTEMELTINVSYYFEDRNDAMRHLSDFRRKAGRSVNGVHHELKYYYLLPKVNVVILKHLYDLREAQVGYGETMSDWFKNHFSDQVEVKTNADGSRLSFAKTEVQAGIVGRYDFTLTPPKPEENDVGKHVVTFSYILRYERPSATVMRYPLLVHNQPINPDFYDRAMAYELGHRLQLPSRTRLYLDGFTNNGYITAFEMGAPVPIFNEWIPTTTPAFVEGMLRVMVVLDPNDRRDLFNFTQLGELTMEDFLLEYIRSERLNLTKYKASVLFLGLYEDDKMLDENSLIVDADLNVRATFDLDLRKQYQVFLGMITRWGSVDINALDRIRQDGATCIELLKGLDVTLEDRDLLPSVNTNNYVTRTDLNKAIDVVEQSVTPANNNMIFGHFRVGQYIIATQHQGNE